MTDKVPSEDQEQMLFVQWFRRTHPGVLIHSVPNGGHRHIAVAAKLKATGSVAGIPDLFIPAWNLWVEMKRQKGGVLSAEQREIINYLEGVGHAVIIGKGCEDAKTKLMELRDDR